MNERELRGLIDKVKTGALPRRALQAANFSRMGAENFDSSTTTSLNFST